MDLNKLMQTTRKIPYKNCMIFFLSGMAIIFLHTAVSLVLKGSGMPENRVFLLASSVSYAVCLLSTLAYALHQHKMIKKTHEPLYNLAELGHVVAQVSHDLKSPLASLQTANLLLRKHQNDELKGLSALVDMSVKRMHEIIDDLMERRNGGVEASKRFDVNERLARLVNEFKLGYDRINFINALSPTPLLIDGLPKRLQRAFANIIKNAAEAMGFKGRIMVETGVKGGFAAIKISDNGPGMSSQLINSILNGEGQSHGKRNGHGIGLVFVREVILYHGGRLAIASEKDRGTTFTVALPLAHEGQAMRANPDLAHFTQPAGEVLTV